MGIILFLTIKSPGKAMLLSLLIPGGGQFYNEAYLKGIVLGGAETTLFYLAYRENKLSHQEIEKEEYHLSMFRKYLFWAVAVTAYSMADAWVDANMYGFDEETKLGFYFKKNGVGVFLRW